VSQELAVLKFEVPLEMDILFVLCCGKEQQVPMKSRLILTRIDIVVFETTTR
jgi:hypothetical protein